VKTIFLDVLYFEFVKIVEKFSASKTNKILLPEKSQKKIVKVHS